jgi:diaminopimelate epimerase
MSETARDSSGRTVPFFKYHGLGNDFVVIDATRRPELIDHDWNSSAPAICDRRTGIGADGILILSARLGDHGINGTKDRADVAMMIVNSDGTGAQMCGNGLRCIAKHLVERVGVRSHPLKVLTGRGVLDIVCESHDVDRSEWSQTGRFANVSSVTVDMGSPILEAAMVPVHASMDRVLDVPLSSLGTPSDHAELAAIEAVLTQFAHDNAVHVSCVSMGNPHAVFFVRSFDGLPLHELGSRIERLSVFPEKTNVHFVAVDSPTTSARPSHSASMLTWERGAGATQACGTGACAVHVAGVLTNRLATTSTLKLPGGDLQITWDSKSPTRGVQMKGPATHVYSGTLELPRAAR